MTFAERLRELRQAAGLSRKGLAEKAGLKSDKGIRDLEQGLNGPTWTMVQAISAALGVSCEAFQVAPAAIPESVPPVEGAEKAKRGRGRPKKGGK